MLPHRIRLRGPWHVKEPHEVRWYSIHLPDQWSTIGDAPVEMMREFGWPAPLAPHERVWIVFDGLRQPCQILLNDQPLGSLAEYEITPLLRERNHLRVDLPAGARWDQAALEVRAQAWLSELSARRDDDRLIVRGRLNGTAERRLDLYAILNRRTVIQTALDASGQTFELSSEALPADLWQPTVRIELMGGAAVWHAADIPLADT